MEKEVGKSCRSRISDGSEGIHYLLGTAACCTSASAIGPVVDLSAGSDPSQMFRPFNLRTSQGGEAAVWTAADPKIFA